MILTCYKRALTVTKNKISHIEIEENKKKKIRGIVKSYRIVLLIESILYFGITNVESNYTT